MFHYIIMKHFKVLLFRFFCYLILDNSEIKWPKPLDTVRRWHRWPRIKFPSNVFGTESRLCQRCTVSRGFGLNSLIENRKFDIFALSIFLFFFTIENLNFFFYLDSFVILKQKTENLIFSHFQFFILCIQQEI